MAQWVTVAKTGDIAPGEGKCVTAAGIDIAVFNVEGAYYAISDTCPHAGGPLSEGYIENGEVTCPWHGWCFKLETDPAAAPVNDGVTRYHVAVENGEIRVQID